MEAELEAQLQEYAVALQGIDEAMKAEPHEELAEVRESLLAAVSELESALLEIKRSRLLASLSQVGEQEHPLQEEFPPTATLLEPLQPLQTPLSGPSDSATQEVANNGHANSLQGGGSRSGTASALVGAHCRFRYLDGRWYRGQVDEVQEGSDMASVSFEAPTRSYMLSGAKVRLSGLRPPRGRASLGPSEPPSFVSPTQDPRGSGLQGSQKVFQAGDRVFVCPGKAHQQQQQQQQQKQQLQQQLQGLLWRAASVVSVTSHGSEVVVMYEQDGTRSRVSRSDVVSEAWDGCSDLESDADDEDVNEDEGTQGSSSSGSSSESGSDMDLYDAEDDGCQAQGVPGLGADGGATQHQYGQRSRKRPRQNSQEGDGEGGSVLGHVREAKEAGQLQDTKHFAQWEKHGRGVASRLMAKSGYTEGSGLGRRRSGIVAPVQALVLPKGQGLGLGSAGRSLGEDGEGSNATDGGPLKRKRGRGGERKRNAKHAMAGREAREARHRHEDEHSARGGAPGLFGFLNQALGDNSSAAAKIRDHQQAMFKHPTDTSSSKNIGLQGPPQAGGSGKGGGKGSSTKEAGGADARARLMRQQGKVEHCQARVAHFQEMLHRNRANPSLASQIAQRLKDVQAELASEMLEQARMSKSITGKDNQKKMLKF